MQKVLIATTLPLASLSHYLANLIEWKKISCTVLVLISKPDADKNRQELHLLYENSLLVHFYQPASSYKTPSLQQVILSFSAFPDHDVYSFVNADIIPRCPLNIPRTHKPLHCAFPPNRVLFARRHDYTPSKLPQVYRNGFDLFSIPTDLMSSVQLQSLQRVFIGQVGWDYFLPLSLPRSIVQFSSDLPLYHLIHPTGSTCSWESSILDVFHHVHPTWVASLSLTRRLIYYFCLWASLSYQSASQLYPSTKSTLKYLLSRIIYYGFLRHLLV